MKMPAMLKRQRFKDSGSEETKPRDSKHQRLYMHSNKEGEILNKFEGEEEGEAIEYVPFLFVVPSQMKSNCPTDMGKGTRSLNHLV